MAGAGFTDGYRKARRVYVGLAGVVATWHLLGLSLDPAGYFGVGIAQTDNAPMLLLAGLIYFAYRVQAEFNVMTPAIDSAIRHHVNMDLVVCHTIFAFSVVAYVAQTVYPPILNQHASEFFLTTGLCFAYAMALFFTESRVQGGALNASRARRYLLVLSIWLIRISGVGLFLFLIAAIPERVGIAALVSGGILAIVSYTVAVLVTDEERERMPIGALILRLASWLKATR